ncbi:MAG: putative formate dehydrogenase formation protein [Gemmatimonadetes bacterium]|nr:putative formate dehydrogenase formation protein [Gemmatimonadota bacterium]
MSPSAPTRRPSAASRTLAEQLQPIVQVHDAVREQSIARVDVDQARTRIKAGRAGFDAATVLRSAGDLRPAFERTAAAFELTGIASTPRIAAVAKTARDAATLVLAWANAESQPRDGTLRLARSVAAIVGNAVLARASADVLMGFPLSAWKRTQCPCCGASPDLALATDTRRTLVCWRCDTMWRTDHRGCLGCGADGPPTLARVASPYLGYELAICNSCGRYLKERRGSLTHELLVERTLVAGLDEAAQQRGLRA